MMYEYGDPRIQVINRRCDGTIIPDEEMDGMVIPVNDRTIVAYRIMLEVSERLAQQQATQRAAGK